MIAFITIVSAVILETVAHWFIIERCKEDPKDNIAFTFTRTVLYIALGTAWAGPAYQWTIEYVIILLSWVGIIVAVRWVLFDYVLNLLRGKPFFYLGDKTWDDRLEAKVNTWLLLGIKVIAFLAIMLVFITQG